MNRLTIPLLATCLLSPSISHSEIYRYQDSKGNWHFTDRAPASKRQHVKTIQSQQAKSSNPSAAKEDLKANLYKKYSPQSAIEKNTLAVVKVKTMMGSGSGFFISDSGYIVTNRHVIRPNDFNADKVAAKFEELEQKLNSNRRELKNYKNRLAKREKEQKRYKRYLSGLMQSELAAETEKYNRYTKETRQFKKDVKRFAEKVRNQESKYKEAKREYDVRSSNTSISKQFSIYLKDNTELIAELVKLSNKYDLALLRLNGYKTPFINLNRDKSYSQGTPVYAIGSPLGMKDHMTSGIITNIQKHQLITDAKILPGNSGGPLVNKEGEVLGVNTQKIARGSAHNDGFGVAISTSAIKEEFSFALP